MGGGGEGRSGARLCAGGGAALLSARRGGGERVAVGKAPFRKNPDKNHRRRHQITRARGVSGHARPLAARGWGGGKGGGDLGTQPRRATRFAATALGVPQPAPRRADPARCRRHLHRIPSRSCPAAAGPNSGPGSGAVWVTEFVEERGRSRRWERAVGRGATRSARWHAGTRRGHDGERGYREYGAMRRRGAAGCGEGMWTGGAGSRREPGVPIRPAAVLTQRPVGIVPPCGAGGSGGTACGEAQP